MSARQDVAARTVLDVVPLVMRTLANHMRHSTHALRPAHYAVLIALVGSPRNLGELAERMAVSAPTMSNSISILEQRGWVQRVRDEDDRRKVLIALSDQGRRMLADMQAEAIAVLGGALRSLDSDQCDTLTQGLLLLRDCLGRNMGADELCLAGDSADSIAEDDLEQTAS